MILSEKKKTLYMKKETKSKIYKVTVRPIMIYALDTRSRNIKKNRQMLEADEVKLLRKIVGKTK